MFKAQEKYRVRKGKLASDASFGNNGVFFIPAGTEAVPDENKVLVHSPYFILCVLSDQRDWEHIAVAIHTIGPPRAPVKEEVEAVRNMFWGKDDTVVQFTTSSNFKDDNPHTVHLWRNPLMDIPVPPAELFGLEKKSGLLTIAKSIITGR